MTEPIFPPTNPKGIAASDAAPPARPLSSEAALGRLLPDPTVDDLLVTLEQNNFHLTDHDCKLIAAHIRELHRLGDDIADEAESLRPGVPLDGLSDAVAAWRRYRNG